MSDTDYTFEFLSVSKDFLKELDINYQTQKQSILKQLIELIEEGEGAEGGERERGREGGRDRGRGRERDREREDTVTHG